MNLVSFRPFAAIILACAALAAACGGGGGGGGLQIDGAWMRVPATDSTAVYMVVRNRTGVDDWLTGATVDGAERAELMETRVSGGRSTMKTLDRIAVRAGDTVRFEPGGYHVHLLGVRRGLKAGDRVTVRLRFLRAGTRRVVAEVRPLVGAGDGGMEIDHGGTNPGGMGEDGIGHDAGG